MGRDHRLLLFAMALFFIMNSAYVAEAAISFGSVQAGNTASVEAGGTVQFKLLLFNAHDASGLYISAGYDSPPGWSVSMAPNNFILPYRGVGDTLPEDGYEFLSTGSGDVKAKPAWVRITVPKNEKTGSYKVSVIINAKKQSSGVSMSQSRTYAFTVNVDGNTGSTEVSGQEGAAGAAMPQQTEVQEAEQSNVTSLTGAVPEALRPEEVNKFREEVENQIRNVTGMIITNPLIGPAALGMAVLVFILMRAFKKI